jgi:ketosteroid isomerase-like protein
MTDNEATGMNIQWWGLVILMATSSRAMTPPEAAIRQADADWAEAAATTSVDAWMTYYAPEAVVLAPDQPIATDPLRIRRAVAQLLSLPHLAISWHPVKVEVAAAGDLAYVIGAYELSYDDPRAVRTTDRGKLLEVWRKLGDGRWKCIVDTWNSDGPGTPPPDAARAGPAAPAAPLEAAPAIAAPAVQAPPPAPQAEEGGDYGAMPVDYAATVHRYFQENLSDPDSARYRDITAPQKSAIKALTNGVFIRQSTLKGWSVKATVDARNSHGVYVGFKTYTFLFRGEKIVHTLSPLGGDEMK